MARSKRTRKRQRKQQDARSAAWYRGCAQGPKTTPRKKPTNSDAPAFYRTSRWRGLRGYVLHRDGNACQYCGARAIQADHVIPRGSGGPDDVKNLVAACTSCNRVAGGRVFDSFDAKKAWILATRKIGLRALAAANVVVLQPQVEKPRVRRERLDADLVKKATRRDQRRCIVCTAPCGNVVRLSFHKPVDIGNVATMCRGCEHAARSLPPDQEMSVRNIMARRSIGT